MSPPCDDAGEMERDPALDDRTAEDVLRGHTAALGEEHRELVDVVAALRRDAAAPPRPNAELLRVFSEGLPQDPAASVVGTAVGAGFSLRRSLAKVAGLSVVAKLALAGAAAAGAVVGGAGAAGVLPGQGSDGRADVHDVADDAVTEPGDLGEGPDMARDDHAEEPAGRGDRGADADQQPSERAETSESPESGDTTGQLPEGDPPSENARPREGDPTPDPTEDPGAVPRNAPIPDDAPKPGGVPDPDIAPKPDGVPDPDIAPKPDGVPDPDVVPDLDGAPDPDGHDGDASQASTPEPTAPSTTRDADGPTRDTRHLP